MPTLSGDLVDYANLDHAASTPAFERVARAVETATRTYSSVHRGTGWLSRVTSAHYEAARDEVARFVGAREDDVVVFTRSTTDSVNLLARALPRDTSVVVFDSEHHATLLPWRGRDTVRLPVPGSTRDAEALLEAALRALPAGTARRPRQALVVLTAASNVTGELWPVERLTAIARRHGARVLLDAAQYAAHRLDRPRRPRRRLGRLLGAQGARPLRHRCARRPQRLAGCRAALPRRWRRHRAGHRARHPLGDRRRAPRGRQPERARRHRPRRGLRDDPRAPRGDRGARGRGSPQRLLDGLRGLDGVTTYSIFGDDTERGPVVTFTVDGLDSHLVAAALSAEHGIGVRAGKFCAHILVDTLLEEGSDEHDTAVRVSAGLASTPEHVERLLAAVATLAAEGPGAEYEHTAEQGWAPVDDTRELSAPLPW